jgi:hypothetical protein
MTRHLAKKQRDLWSIGLLLGRMELLQARLWLDGTRVGTLAKPLAKSTTLEAAVDRFVLEACPDLEEIVVERVALGAADSTPSDRTKLDLGDLAAIDVGAAVGVGRCVFIFASNPAAAASASSSSAAAPKKNAVCVWQGQGEKEARAASVTAFLVGCNAVTP